MKTVKNFTRSDLKKPKSYKARNWTKNYDEKGVKKVVEQTVEKLKPQNIKNKLERTPEKDILDFSGEEKGFFKIGNEVFETKFPR